MAEDIVLHGFDELDRKLHDLPDKMAKKILRQSTVEAAKVVQTEADGLVRDKAKIKGGKTVRIVTSQKQGGSQVTCHVTATKKRWYLKFLETGTVIHNKTMKKLPHTANIMRRIALRKGGMWHIVPKPWLRPAMDAKKNQTLDVLGKELGQRIEAEMKL